jgi:hypothetical protein
MSPRPKANADTSDLLSAPELGIIGVLEVALTALRAALILEHSTLIDELGSPTEPRTLRAARRLTLDAGRLSRALARYRRALALSRAPPKPSDDWSF